MMRRISLAFAALALTAAAASAGSLFDPQAAGFRPLVPISALGVPASWFDPSRLHLSSTITVGSGFGGGTNALQVTNFQYQLARPLSMSVSLGNAFGTGSASNSSFFLEGLDLTYKPGANSLLRVQFRDVRSPLQYGYGYMSGPYDRGLWGY
jgi:hypothetical protein